MAILKYHEFAPSKVLPIIKRDDDLMKYFPDELFSPKCCFNDRVFTWSVLFAKKKEWANAYYDEVVNFHNKSPMKVVKKNEITISEEWMKDLMMYDFVSKERNLSRKMNILTVRKCKAQDVKTKKRTFEKFQLSQQTQALFSEDDQVKPQSNPFMPSNSNIREIHNASLKSQNRRDPAHYTMTQT